MATQPETTSDAVALKNEGNALFKEGNYAAAAAKYDAALARDAASTACLANRAQCELKLEMYGQAVETCTQALALDAANVKCYFRRALAHSHIAKHALAVRDFERVVQLAPDFAPGRAKLRAAQGLARAAAFRAAIQTEDEPSVLDSFDLDTLPASDGPDSEPAVPLDLDAITDEAVASLAAHFRAGRRLPRRTVFDIVRRTARLFAAEPTMNELSSADHGAITVCGDTHGQYFDLMHILGANGWPAERHTYVFNGDFVDRGSWSTEIALLLYVLKLQRPRNVYINRGNHETDSMNAVYGFSGECKAKYRMDKVFAAFSESFAKLPLACLINGDYLVVHGGLFSKDGVTLDDIRKIDRFASRQPRSEGLTMEMLWSDPQPANGRAPSKRGIAHMFGPDVTRRFTDENKLKAVIRSHECCDNGYEVAHDGRLITIFSAPNYCDSTGNKGAYININAASELAYTTFDASPHPDVPPMAYASSLMR